jgi:hypothetical protein
MAQLNFVPPNLPLAPEQYQRYYQDQLNNILRLFFNQLSNPGDMGGTSLNLNTATLPTDADLPNLRIGDVYRDTQGGTLQTGSNLLRIKVPIQLSGVQGAGAVGSVGPVGGTITKGLTGVSSTGAVGFVGGTITLGLTGVSSTGAVGTVTP